ncbi:MAG TPA: efflux transporter outer membrane subunit [Candidatus Acidoferrales bacterium]
MSGNASFSKTVFAGLAAGVLFFFGCKPVGPNYNRPTVETPAAWKEQPPEGWKNAAPSDDISKGNWWEVFGDPQLNDLEIQAIAANQNLKAAAERVIEARAIALVERSNLFPSVGGDPSVGRARTSGNRPLPNPSIAFTANTFSLPVEASYQVDLWGQIRRSLESANALTQASVANYENVLLTLKSDVASFYIMLHFIDQERAILRDNIDLQQKALDLAQVRHTGGVASGLDVSEAETLLDTTQADYVGLGVQRAQFEHALATLLGRPPSELTVAEKALDLAPPVIPAGMPSDLLERRPDIAGAERTMASTNAQIGVARSAYFPNLVLTGSGGYLSSGIVNLFNLPSLAWSAAANLSQPLYTGGRLSANLLHARATYDESVATYRQQVLVAFREVEDGLSGLRVLEEQAAAYDKAVKSAQQTVDISTARYKEGLANYLEVITAEITLLNSERVGDQVLEQRLLTTVQLIEALGGGWQESTVYTTSTGSPLNSTPPNSSPANPSAPKTPPGPTPQ